MAFLEIPLDYELPSYKFTIQLDDTIYTLQFNWNTRNSRWFMDIMLQDETPVLMGQPCLVSYNFLARFKDTRLPRGAMVFYDSSGQELDPGRTDLGARVQLFYQGVT